MSVRLVKYSYRFAEQVFNGRLNLKTEMEDIILEACKDLTVLSRPNLNKILDELFVNKGWQRQAPVFSSGEAAYAKMDFLKERIGVEVQFGHASFIGIDLLKMQIASYSNLDNIDFGVYIVTTNKMQKYLKDNYKLKWDCSLSYEKVIKYLPHIKSAIQVPIYVIGIDI
ncbi:MAG: restriction endonuclease [Enterocloster asparagiformis]|nr:restriction endonuclease [Enterocloster asparagiformis]